MFRLIVNIYYFGLKNGRMIKGEIDMEKLPIAKIDREHFINWLYNDNHEISDLVHSVLDSIADSGSFYMDIESEFGGLGGFYPKDMIDNYDDIKSEIESCEGFDNGWLDNPSEYMEVKWT